MMSLRLLAGSLLLGSFALIERSMPFQSSQGTEKPTLGPQWQYKALKLDASQCSVEGLVANSLNAAADEPRSHGPRPRASPANSRRLSRNYGDEDGANAAGSMQISVQAPRASRS